MIKELAISLAGHDKGHLYAVVGRENGILLLADGRVRKVNNPKKKNVRHVQIIKHHNAEFLSLLSAVSQDSDLVSALRIYKKLALEEE